MPTEADLEQAYRDRFAAFVRVAHGITRDREAAYDAVQETFASALSARRSYRGEGAVEAWLWRMLVNSALKARPRPELELVVDNAVESPPLASVLKDPIRRLPERQRLVLFLRYYADLDYRNIADCLGVEIGTVSATLNAVHATLRAQLEEGR